MLTSSPAAISATHPVKNLVVIGLGLIGGSLAAAAKKHGLCSGRIIGIARRDVVCERALELGLVDEAYCSLDAIAGELSEGDVVFIAVPTLSVEPIFSDLAKQLSDTVTITDGASVKGSVLDSVVTVYGKMPRQVVLGHPIAGSEKSGVDAAKADLYDKHRVILTPVDGNGENHIERVRKMWQAVGAEVVEMSVDNHDEILAATSHLPHAIAFSLVDTLAHDSKNENIFRYAAGGFRDFTRIASSDATMWRDIMLANKTSVVDAIDLFSENLQNLRSIIEQENGDALLEVFVRAKSARDHFTLMLASIKPEDES